MRVAGSSSGLLVDILFLIILRTPVQGGDESYLTSKNLHHLVAFNGTYWDTPPPRRKCILNNGYYFFLVGALYILLGDG